MRILITLGALALVLLLAQTGTLLNDSIRSEQLSLVVTAALALVGIGWGLFYRPAH